MRNQSSSTIYKKMERFAELTKTLIAKGQIERAKKCFAVAEDLLRTGNSEMKTAVSNVFLFSVSCFMELKNCNIKNLLPALLESEYKLQTSAS